MVLVRTRILQFDANCIHYQLQKQTNQNSGLQRKHWIKAGGALQYVLPMSLYGAYSLWISKMIPPIGYVLNCQCTMCKGVRAYNSCRWRSNVLYVEDHHWGVSMGGGIMSQEKYAWRWPDHGGCLTGRAWHIC